MNGDGAARLTGRRLRVGLLSSEALVQIEDLPPGSNVVIGGSSTATLSVPGWTRPDLLLVDAGKWLVLGPGMRVRACHDRGEDRIDATFEELEATGTHFPIPMDVSRYNVTVEQGLSVLIEFRITRMA